jgi:uncharacterized OB-fold protein
MIAVAADLFTLDEATTGAGTALLGSRCTGCGTHYFPRAVSCRNPECTAKELEPAELGRTGTLYSWTVQNYQPPALFRVDDWKPYAIGVVELPEGLRVLAMLTGAPPGEIPIGAELTLTNLPLYRDGDGQPVVTYAYAPAGGAA